jgi:transposase
MMGLVVRTIDPATRDRVDVLVKQNLSLRAVAAEAGVSHEYVRQRRQALLSEGVELPSRPAPVFVVHQTPVDELKRLADTGMLGPKIAEKMGVTVRTVYRVSRKHGLSVNREKVIREITEADIARMAQLYAEDRLALRDIAVEYGTTPKRVGRLLVKHGVKMRSSGRQRAA